MAVATRRRCTRERKKRRGWRCRTRATAGSPTGLADSGSGARGASKSGGRRWVASRVMAAGAVAVEAGAAEVAPGADIVGGVKGGGSGRG